MKSHSSSLLSPVLPKPTAATTPSLTILPSKGSPLSETIANVTKSMVGSGMLLMPMCYAHFGLLVGTLITAICVVTSITTLTLVCKASSRYHSKDFMQLAAHNGGRSLESLVVSLVALLVLSPVLVTIKQSTSYLVSSLNFLIGYRFSDLFISIILCVFFLWPMSTVSSSRNLAIASQIGILGMIYILTLIVSDAIASPIHPTWSWISTSTSWTTQLASFNVMLFSLSCHLTIQSLLSSLDHCTPSRQFKAISISCLLAGLFQLLAAASGFLVHGAATPEDVLLARPNNIFYVIGQLVIVVVNVVSFPLVLIPIRALVRWWSRQQQKNNSSDFIYQSINKSHSHLDTPSSSSFQIIDNNNSSSSSLLHISDDATSNSSIVTGGIVLLVGLVVGSLFKSMVPVFNVIGAITNGLLFISFPAIACLTDPSNDRRTRLILLLIALSGLCLSITCTISLF